MHFSPDGRVCSFCGVVGSKRTRFAGGIGAMICPDCVEVFHADLQKPRSRTATRRPPWQDMTDVEMLAMLPEIEKVSAQASEFMVEWVGLIRGRKVSWSQIGQALGVTRQAAWERFSRAVAAADDAPKQAKAK